MQSPAEQAEFANRFATDARDTSSGSGEYRRHVALNSIALRKTAPFFSPLYVVERGLGGEVGFSPHRDLSPLLVPAQSVKPHPHDVYS